MNVLFLFLSDHQVAFAQAGFPVFSNARNHRYDDTVPILIPHANADHIKIIPHQKSTKNYDGNGYIITNANCSSTGLVVALRPIFDHFGIDKMIVFTMQVSFSPCLLFCCMRFSGTSIHAQLASSSGIQAISGAGYPGVASLDILDNVVPYISGEEPKMELEPNKVVLGLCMVGSRCSFNGLRF